jgi:hypothetical protein
VWAGIGAWRLSAAAAAARVRLAREAGANGIAIFSWDSVAAERDGGRRYLATLRTVLLEAPGRPAGRE